MSAQQIIQAIQENPAQVWLFMPAAILLGALHGLEPGHSKTMMAAFIIAVRGTIFQAILLGLSAAASHTAVIWILAAFALYFGQHFAEESTEPYFQVGSGVIILGTALWMAWQTRRDIKAAADHGHGHSHSHDHEHDHDDDHEHHHGQMIVDTGHGLVELSVFEENVPPRFEVRFLTKGGKVGEPWPQSAVKLETIRPDGSKQKFTFARDGQAFIGQEPIPEPHEFAVTLFLGHEDHFHKYELMFLEDGPHDEHAAPAEYQDAHEKAHADEISQRFGSGSATTGQIILFGLTGGLIPCPAALSIVLVCLQLKQFTLGFALVLCFSVGLALTLVTVGVVAAWSVNHLAKRSAGLSQWARRVPYLSSGLLGVLSLYMIYLGAHELITHG